VTTEQTQANISFTDSAAKRVQELKTEEGNYKLNLRVYITGGGCSGFQYGFAFDEKIGPDDSVIAKTVSDAPNVNSAVNMVIDALSIMYLDGAQIDYVENLQGAHFVVKNPNAMTTCSCGSSFSL
jgi:iron-sulfur cluster insertion protein